MNIKLFFEAILKYILGVILVGVLIFVPAGTFEYFNGLLFMGLLFIPMFIVGTIMMFMSPDLLRSRLDVKEKESEQKDVIVLSGIMFLTGFVVAGLNYRFSWIEMPNIIVLIASILFLLSYVIYAEVLRKNAF